MLSTRPTYTLLFGVCLIILTITAVVLSNNSTPQDDQTASVASVANSNTAVELFNDLQFASPDIGSQEFIPPSFTCDGEEVSPSFVLSRPAPETRSFALSIVDRSEKAPWVQLLIWDIPITVRSIDSGELVHGVYGSNATGYDDYLGPCPKKGDRAHEYEFTLYELDQASLNLAKGSTEEEFQIAARAHIVDTHRFKKSYQRVN